jgi:hypothetical protein
MFGRMCVSERRTYVVASLRDAMQVIVRYSSLGREY